VRKVGQFDGAARAAAGHVDRQEAHVGHAGGQLLGQVLGHVGLLAVAVGVG